MRWEGGWRPGHSLTSASSEVEDVEGPHHVLEGETQKKFPGGHPHSRARSKPRWGGGTSGVPDVYLLLEHLEIIYIMISSMTKGILLIVSKF